MPVPMEDLFSSSSPTPPSVSTAAEIPAASPPRQTSSSPTTPKSAITADDLLGPVTNEPETPFNVGEALWSLPKAFARGSAQTAAAAGTVFEWGAALIDVARPNAQPGKETAQQYAHRTWVQPWLERAQALEPTMSKNTAQNITNTVGTVLGETANILNQALLMPQLAVEKVTAPLVESVARSAFHGMKTMVLPASTAAVNTVREVYNATGDKGKAVSAGMNVFTNTSLMGVAPVAMRGSIPTRLASGAVTGIAIGEASRVSTNQVLPDEMKQDFSWAGLLQEGLMGAGLGLMAGKKQLEYAGKLKAAIDADPTKLDEFVINNPDAAKEVADHIAPVDPMTAKYIKNRIDKYTKASEKDLEEIGRKRVEAALAPPGLFDYATGRYVKDVTGGLRKELKKAAKPAVNADELLAQLKGTKPDDGEPPPPGVPVLKEPVIDRLAKVMRDNAPKDELSEGDRAELGGMDTQPSREEIRSRPGVNARRMAKMLGPQLYGDPTNMAVATIKEVLQNSYDAIKSSINLGNKQTNRIDIKTDSDARTVHMVDNGVGMGPDILGTKFLEIAGTGKEGGAASGGFGIAKMLFLYGNKDLHVISMRDGKVSEMKTTGEQLFDALENPELAPTITVRQPTPADRALFMEGHGTSIKLTIPESFKDPASGETKRIEMPRNYTASKDIQPLAFSPLFAPIEVTFNGRTVETGEHFQHDKYTHFVNAKFDWGNVRIYVTKKPTGQTWGENLHVLSNGLWQFSRKVTKDPANRWSPILPYEFYVDINPSVRPEDPGYPFNFNRQNFTETASTEFNKVMDHINALYAYSNLEGEAQSFGTIRYLGKAGDKVLATPMQEVKPVIPAPKGTFNVIKEGSQVTVHEGKLLVDGKEMPELKPEELKAAIPDTNALKVDQKMIKPYEVMVHDNTDVQSSADVAVPFNNMMADTFGPRYNEYLHHVGDSFLRLRDMVSKIMDYPELKNEAVGISIDPTYRGVSIRVPFSGNFINPFAAEATHPVEASYGMLGTMLHELAHHKVRNHDESFPQEMQRILFKLDSQTNTTYGFNFDRFRHNFVQEAMKYEDIIVEGKRLLENGRARGNSFKDSSESVQPGRGDAGDAAGNRRNGGAAGAGQRLLEGADAGGRATEQRGATGKSGGTPERAAVVPNTPHPAWMGLAQAMEPIYADMIESSPGPGQAGSRSYTVTTSHKLLDQMSSKTYNPALRGLLETLRDKVDDVPIRRNPNIDAGALYFNGAHRITSALDPNNAMTTVHLVHEVAHAGTVRFIDKYPNHPSVRRLVVLRQEALRRARAMEKVDGVKYFDLYGLRGDMEHAGRPVEFVAEALSNSNFHKFLVESEKYASKTHKAQPTLMTRLLRSLREMLGVKDEQQAKLFDEVMHHSFALLDETAGKTREGVDLSPGMKVTRPSRMDDEPTDLTTERLRRLTKSGDVYEPKSMLEVFDALEDGDRVYRWHEMDEQPYEVKPSEVHEYHLPEGYLIEKGALSKEKDKVAGTKGTVKDVRATIQQIADGTAEATAEMVPSAKGKATAKWGTEPTIYTSGLSRDDISAAFTMAHEFAQKVPGWKIAEGKVKEYVRYFVRNFVPESLSPEAEIAGADVTAAIATRKARDASIEAPSGKRREFWNKNIGRSWDFIKGYEKGAKFSDDAFNKIADFYRDWSNQIFKADQKAGIEYDPRDNYITHLFEDEAGVAEELHRRYGAKWGDPYFMKNRLAESYEYLSKLKNPDGSPKYPPRFENPEDIFMARQHASNVAHMRIEMLNDLEKHGLAKVIKKGEDSPDGFSPDPRRSPNGKLYWIHQDAMEILHNAFDTQSMWTLKGPVGDLYRGLMDVKNYTVAIRLFGLFHPVHLGLVTNNAAALTRATKNILTGNVNPKNWLPDVVRGLTPLSGVWTYKSPASRILKAYWGKLGKEELSSGEQMALQYMAEGGMVPGMAAQDRITIGRRFMDAVQQGKKGSAAFKLPFAIIGSLQQPMFHIWIPQLKIAAYMRDVATAFRVNPELVSNPDARRMALRQLAKSVDNRFGEMSYDTMFWNRTVKDIAVLNTLSVGWQMGLIREFGGGAVQVGELALKEGTIPAKIKAGELDKAFYSTYYIGLSALYGGLIMMALTGKWPQTMLDYFAPQSGGENADGTPKRITTPMFTREIVAIQKHMENEGVVSGLTHLVQNKASGVIGLVGSTITGVDGLGREIRDPNAPKFKQLEQTLLHIFKDVQPISATATEKAGEPITSVRGAMAVAGFQPAPRYLMETPVHGDIKATFQKYNARLTPYDQAAMSADRTKLKQAYEANSPEYDTILDAMEQKYELSPQEVARIEKGLLSDANPAVRMFSRLPWKEQKRILDKHWYEMTPDQQEDFLAKSSKEHLRYDYEPPKEHK